MRSKWNFYDKDGDFAYTSLNLPHWDQTNSLTFVTMRLADSMPRDVVKEWHREIEQWLVEHNLQGRSVESVLNDTKVDEQLKKNLKLFKHRRWHGHLDDCHGSCALRRSDLANVVAASFRHFDNERYDLERFVVMPNHAHQLIQMRGGYDLRKQLSEIMRFSGRKVNRLLNRSGPFWQSEPFDHLVRSDEQFAYLQNYIRENPAKANLRAGEYIFWQCDHDSESRVT